MRQFDVDVFLLFMGEQISCLVFMPVALYLVFTARLPQFIFISDLLIYSIEINTENAKISMLNNSQEKIQLSNRSACAMLGFKMGAYGTIPRFKKWGALRAVISM